MSPAHRDLLSRLEAYYRRAGWPVRPISDGTLEATGPGGVTWIGTAVLDADLHSDQLGPWLLELADRRMSTGGELCPLDLATEIESEGQLRDLLRRIGLSDRPHVSIYSVSAPSAAAV